VHIRDICPWGVWVVGSFKVGVTIWRLELIGGDPRSFLVEIEIDGLAGLD